MQRGRSGIAAEWGLAVVLFGAASKTLLEGPAGGPPHEPSPHMKATVLRETGPGPRSDHPRRRRGNVGHLALPVRKTGASPQAQGRRCEAG